MNPTPKIVFFAIPVHAFLRLTRASHPELWPAMDAVSWDRGGDASYVTPHLFGAEAETLRTALGSLPDAEEHDVTRTYALSYTTAPESYDGYGTLMLGREGDERLVAIVKEHLNWQAAHYASGLYRFRPAAAPPAGAGAAPANDAADAQPVRPGVVVRFRGRSRRYVVATAERIGGTELYEVIALSGALKGCHATRVAADELERDVDQTIAFAGSAAGTLQRKYAEATHVERLAS
jgi:hypothetical protein